MVSPKDKLFGEKDGLFIPVQAFVPLNYLLSCQLVLNNVGLTENMSQPQCSCRCSVTSWICWSLTMVSVPCM